MASAFCTNLSSLNLMPPADAAAALNVRFPDDPPYSEEEVLVLTSRALAKLRRLAVQCPGTFDLMLSEVEPEAPAQDLGNVLREESDPIYQVEEI